MKEKIDIDARTNPYVAAAQAYMARKQLSQLYPNFLAKLKQSLGASNSV